DLEVSFSEIRVTAAFGEMGNKHRGVESGGDSISLASRTSTNWHLLDREHTQNVRNLLIINYLKSWRRGGAEYSHVLKTRNLLKNRAAQNALASEIAPNWNVSGTRIPA